MSGERPDIERLADLDAGLLEPRRAQQARAAALEDPRSAAVLDALAATRAELAGTPTPPIPPEVAARWAAAVEAAAHETGVRETAPHETGALGTASRGTGALGTGAAGTGAAEPPAPLGESRPAEAPSAQAIGTPAPETDIPGTDAFLRPRAVPGPVGEAAHDRDQAGAGPRRSSPGRVGGLRARRPRPALLVAALLAVFVAAGILWPRPTPPSAMDAVAMAATARSAVGVTDAGALTDPTRRAACLLAVAAPGIEPGAPLLGGRQVEFGGQPGILLVFAGDRLGAFRFVIVDPACGPDGGRLLGTATFGP